MKNSFWFTELLGGSLDEVKASKQILLEKMMKFRTFISLFTVLVMFSSFSYAVEITQLEGNWTSVNDERRSVFFGKDSIELQVKDKRSYKLQCPVNEVKSDEFTISLYCYLDNELRTIVVLGGYLVPGARMFGYEYWLTSDKVQTIYGGVPVSYVKD